jgi:hypothetical protein
VGKEDVIFLLNKEDGIFTMWARRRKKQREKNKMFIRYLAMIVCLP